MTDRPAFERTNFTVEPFDRDDEMEFIIAGWELDNQVYFSRSDVVALRDWLTKQIDAETVS